MPEGKYDFILLLQIFLLKIMDFRQGDGIYLSERRKAKKVK